MTARHFKRFDIANKKVSWSAGNQVLGENVGHCPDAANNANGIINTEPTGAAKRKSMF